MSSVIAIVPAKARSTGIPGKNWKPLRGTTPVKRAVNCAREVREIETIIVSTDAGPLHPSDTGALRVTIVQRPSELCEDDTPMWKVVEHALDQVPGPPDQIVLLLQPSQPLRRPAHLRQAIALLEARSIPDGCVISVVPAPSIDKVYTRVDWELWPCGHAVERRQDARPTFLRDGTVYAWRRCRYLYDHPWIALDVDPRDSCNLDTMADWAEAERRLAALR